MRSPIFSVSGACGSGSGTRAMLPFALTVVASDLERAILVAKRHLAAAGDRDIEVYEAKGCGIVDIIDDGKEAL